MLPLEREPFRHAVPDENMVKFLAVWREQAVVLSENPAHSVRILVIGGVGTYKRVRILMGVDLAFRAVAAAVWHGL